MTPVTNKASGWPPGGLNCGQDATGHVIAGSARPGQHQLTRHQVEYLAGNWRILAT